MAHGYPAINPHSFRAAGITEYIRNGGDVETAARIAGHESTRTTQPYNRIQEDVSLDESSGSASEARKEGMQQTKFKNMVGGYGAGAAFGEVWKFAFDDGNLVGPTVVVSAGVPSYVFWAGSGGRALHRLVLGRDEAMPVRLEQAGVEKKVIEAVEQDVYVPLIDPAMPVQDAINLAAFLVDVAKGFCAFAPGMNVVGGETDIATVTRHEGFKWIRSKHYYDAAINRLRRIMGMSRSFCGF